MPHCPRCRGFLYVEAEDGDRYWRCLNCARAFGMRVRDPAPTRATRANRRRR